MGSLAGQPPAQHTGTAADFQHAFARLDLRRRGQAPHRGHVTGRVAP